MLIPCVVWENVMDIWTNSATTRGYTRFPPSTQPSTLCFPQNQLQSPKMKSRLGGRPHVASTDNTAWIKASRSLDRRKDHQKGRKRLNNADDEGNVPLRHGRLRAKVRETSDNINYKFSNRPIGDRKALRRVTEL